MSDASPMESPPPASLVKALLGASVIAGALLVFFVLPAEYNVDVTGFGRAIGLTVLSAPAGEADSTAVKTAEGDPEEQRDDRAVVEVPAGGGVEYKFHLQAGQKMKYSWSSESGDLFYDFHGEPQGAASDVFESFAAGRSAMVNGTFTAPFVGTHGWYWKNSSTSPIRIALETSGSYEVVGLK